MNRSLDAVLQRFYGRHRFGIKPGLGRIRRLLEILGHPERELRAVHVTGTNGKGSVCAMVDSVLQACGLRTGLYTSPHLVRFNERIRVNGTEIPDGHLEPLAVQLEEAAAVVEREQGDPPTFFEVSTALAFEYFRQQAVAEAVVEVGLGGRLDATNVLAPDVSVITSIGLEHTQYLGTTLPEIAREKGGIIKPGVPVVTGSLPDDARTVLAELARLQNTSLRPAGEAVSVRLLKRKGMRERVSLETSTRAYGTFDCPLVGLHQVENLAMAVAVLEVLEERGRVTLDPAVVRKGLAQTRWRGRMEMLSESPPLIIDGAHNPQAASVLAESLTAVAGEHPVGLIMGMCADKDAAGFASAFRRRISRVWLVPIATERNMERGLLRIAVAAMGCPVAEGSMLDALAEARRWALAQDGVVVVAGSLYLAGELLERWDAGQVPWGTGGGVP